MSAHSVYQLLQFCPHQGTKNIATRNVSWPQNIPKCVCGHVSALDPGELTTYPIPPTPSWIMREGRGRERREETGWEGKGKAGKRREEPKVLIEYALMDGQAELSWVASYIP